MEPIRSFYMWRKLAVIILAISFCFTTVSCGSNETKRTDNSNPVSSVTNNTQQSKLPDGKYGVQQASYNDANGEYSLMVLNTPPGSSPTYRTTALQMARLTDEEVKANEKTYLKVENGQVSLYMTEDFKIEYVHNVTEVRNNPQTGQKETIIVRQESSFWTPFAGALAGQALGSLLFRPQYYVPPVYQPGGFLTGYGGYGTSYNQAIDSYRSRYNQPPVAEVNRGRLRTTGRLNSPSTGVNSRTNPSFGTQDRSRSTGAGFGTSTLRQSGQSKPSVNRSSGFGSSSRSRSSSFGGRRR
jgi:hypothetical protein